MYTNTVTFANVNLGNSYVIVNICSKKSLPFVCFTIVDIYKCVCVLVVCICECVNIQLDFDAINC